MKYQDLKIRDTKRMALICVASVILAGAFWFGGHALGGRLGHRLDLWAISLGLLVPFVVVMCVWYLLSTPAQNARFIRWSQKHLRSKLPPDFDWSLLDPADPDYDVRTIDYLLRRRGRGDG